MILSVAILLSTQIPAGDLAVYEGLFADRGKIWKDVPVVLRGQAGTYASWSAKFEPGVLKVTPQLRAAFLAANKTPVDWSGAAGLPFALLDVERKDQPVGAAGWDKWDKTHATHGFLTLSRPGYDDQRDDAVVGFSWRYRGGTMSGLVHMRKQKGTWIVAKNSIIKACSPSELRSSGG